MLSGIFIPALTLAITLGPMMGGFLTENYGYRDATVAVLAIIVIMVRARPEQYLLRKGKSYL